MSNCTESNARNAPAVYREAARRMEEGTACPAASCGYSCCALSLVIEDWHGTTDDYLAVKGAFFSFYDDADWMNRIKSPSNQDQRILALCFMAAITERP